MGAYLQLVTPGIPLLGAWIYSGPYAIPNYSVTFTGVFTHTTPTDAYRGAGRPEATYVLERTMDALAARARDGSGRAAAEELRQGVPAHDGVGAHHRLGRLRGMPRPAARAARPRRDPSRPGGAPRAGRHQADRRRLLDLQRDVRARAVAHPRRHPLRRRWLGRRDDPLPAARLRAGRDGTSPHGQGHETTWAQIVADQLGVGVDDVEVLHGDTAVSQQGMDTYGSRSLTVGGIALYHASQKIIAKARSIVAHQLEVSEDDLEFADGTFTVKGSPDRTMGIQAVAFAAHSAHNLPDGMEPGFEETAVFDPPNFSWPGGAHAAVVEVDTETGDTRLVRYVAVDDVGNAGEPADHRRAGARRSHAGDRGRALRGGRLRRGGQPADHDHDDVPRAVGGGAAVVRDGSRRDAADNPLGVKGVGETGTIAAAPAVINAVVDALSHLGVTDVPLPATPERVWKAIEEARS